ncbi:MAG: histidinol-phosphate transaminase, partial [Desulfocapsaceae bacterium]|nr:histidinol-phosphate transaminase [Desulfocapsaceae bacterium]
NIKDIIPYPPGKPIDELEREYGIAGSIKLASNENPLGPSPLAVDAMHACLAGMHRYPDGSGYYLIRALAEHFGMNPGQFVLGNGSNEIIEFLVKAFVQNGDEVVSSHPSFLMYQKFVQIRGGENIVVPLKAMAHDLEAISSRISERTRLVFLDNPNNPTGTIVDPENLYTFLADVPEHVVVVLDEAYVDFADRDLQADLDVLINDTDNRCGVVSLRTFSKAYGLAGLRIGFGIMPEAIAGCLHKVRQPFNINAIALCGAQAALKDRAFYERTISSAREGKRYLAQELEKRGCRSFPSQTNFFLIDVRGDATVLYESMLRKGVIVRSMKAYGYPNFIRINVGTEAENERFLTALTESLQECGYVS